MEVGLDAAAGEGAVRTAGRRSQDRRAAQEAPRHVGFLWLGTKLIYKSIRTRWDLHQASGCFLLSGI